MSEGVDAEGQEPALGEASRAIEAILMVAEAPVEISLLSQLLEIRADAVETLIGQLSDSYNATSRGFVLVKVAGGYRFQSHPDMAPYLERFVLEGQTAKLSAAALETLAVVAYKQPVSRAQVSAIRGVSAEGVLKTLEQRGYIAEVGRDPGPGQALLYGTTPVFLERLGLDTLAQLPPLGDFVPGVEIMESLEQSLTRRVQSPGQDPQVLDQNQNSEDLVQSSEEQDLGASDSDQSSPGVDESEL